MANLKIAGAVLLVAPALLASPSGEAMGKHLDDGELPGMVSIVVDARGKTTVDCRGFADVAAKSRMPFFGPSLVNVYS